MDSSDCDLMAKFYESPEQYSHCAFKAISVSCCECKAHFGMMGQYFSCFERILVFDRHPPFMDFLAIITHVHKVCKTHDFLQLMQMLTTTCVHVYYYYCNGSWIFN